VYLSPVLLILDKIEEYILAVRNNKTVRDTQGVEAGTEAIS